MDNGKITKEVENYEAPSFKEQSSQQNLFKQSDPNCKLNELNTSSGAI